MGIKFAALREVRTLELIRTEDWSLEDWAGKLGSELQSGETINLTFQPDSTFKSLAWIVWLGIFLVIATVIIAVMQHWSTMVTLMIEGGILGLLFVLFYGLQFELANRFYVITDKRILVLKQQENQTFHKAQDVHLSKVVKIEKDDIGDGSGGLIVSTETHESGLPHTEIALQIEHVPDVEKVYSTLLGLTKTRS